MTSGRSHGAGHGIGLSIVEGFEAREFVRVALDEIGELVQELAALGGAHLAPCAGFECGASGAHGAINVSGVGFGHLADFLAAGGIDGGEGFFGNTVHPFVVD